MLYHFKETSQYDQVNHNHTLQTNLQHRKEEPQNTIKVKQSALSSSSRWLQY